MASSTALFRVSILLIFFLAFFTIAEPRLVLDSQMSTSTQGEGSSLPKSGIDCSGACSVRCSESSRPNLCKRACGTCCLRCNCVPPGTYGNLQMCPCYAALTTHNGQPQMPIIIYIWSLVSLVVS